MADHYLSAEILMDMTKSISQMESYANAVDGLDSKLGSLEGKLNSLNSALTKVKDSKKNNLKETIESQINDAIKSKSVVLESMGDGAFKVNKNVMKTINDKIQKEINTALASQSENIKIQLDPKHKKAITANIGEEHFAKFNGEIVKLVQSKMGEMRKSMKDIPIDLSKAEIDSVALIIGKNMVQSTISAVKEAILPILMKPQVNVEGVKLTIPKKNTRQLVNKVLAEIVKSTGNMEVEGIKISKGQLTEMNNNISKLVSRQISSMNDQLKSVDLNTLEKPINELNRKTKDIIAKQMGTTVKELEKANMTVDNGYVREIKMQQAFDTINKTLNDRVSKISNDFTKAVLAEVKSVSFEVQPSIAHELNSDLNRINKAIIKKIKSQIDVQIAHIISEINAAGVAPGNMNSKNVSALGSIGNSYKPGKSTVNNNTTIINNYGNGNVSGAGDRIRSGSGGSLASDPYARRDDHFNSLGMEGALKNTLRHIVAGSMVGAPIMAIYEAMETFKETQLETLKVFQNYFMQEYVSSPDGDVDKNLIKAQAQELNKTVKDMSVFYGVDYTQMSEVGAIASRLTDNAEDSKKFMDVAAQILRVDNSGDIVQDIAPGLEAIMLQFGMSVWELNRVVASFAVATNVTKASTQELMAALSRSGASFAGAGVTMEQATILTAGAIQSTGLTAPDLGNMFKTLMQRLSMTKVQDTLAENGISVYDEDNNRIPTLQVLQELGNLMSNPKTSDSVVDKVLGDVAGMYQVGKLRAIVGSWNTNGVTVKDDEGKEYSPFNLNDMFDKVDFSTNDKMAEAIEMLHGFLAESLDNPAISMERAGVSVNVALTSVLEELAPQIQNLSDILINVSNVVEDNSDKVAELGSILLKAAVGFGVVSGVKWAVGKGGYKDHMENYKTQDKLYGNKAKASDVAPLMALMGTGLGMFSSRNSNTFDMLNSAKGSTGISSVIDRLTGMDEIAVNRALMFNQDYNGGKNINTMGELNNLLEKSSNYIEADMTKEEREYFSGQRVNEMMNTEKGAAVFGASMATALKGFDYGSASPDNQRMMDSFARMSNSRSAEFMAFAQDISQREGHAINNVDDLYRMNERFNVRNATQAEAHNLDNSGVRNLNNQYNRLEQEVTEASPRQGMGGVVVGAGNMAKATGKSMVQLGKTAGKLALQFGALLAAGEVLLGWMENLALTEDQQEIRSMQKEEDFYKDFFNHQNKVVQGNSKDMSEFILTALTQEVSWLTGSLLDMIPGIDKTGVHDIPTLGADFLDGMKEVFGTDDIEKIKSDYKEEFEKNKTGKYGSEITDDEIIAETLKKIGHTDELDGLELEEYKKRYEDFMIDQNKQLEEQEEQEELKRIHADLLMQKSPWQVNIGELVRLIETDLAEVEKALNMKSMTSLLDGVKSTSQEYYQIMLDGIREKIELYEKEMAVFDSHITSLKEQLSYMEESGEDKLNPELYEQYKSELEEVEKSKGEYSDAIGETLKELQLEEVRTAFEQAKQRVQDVVNSYADDNFYVENDIEMNTAEGTSERGASLRDSIRQKIAQEQEILEMYEGMGELDIDNQTEELIREQRRKLTEFNKEYFATYQQELAEYSKNIDRVESKNSIELLRAQVSSGITDSNDPALKGIRQSLMGKELTAVNTELARAQSTLADLMEQGADKDTLRDYEDKILDLERQSLEVQLEQLSEMKTSKGTFNLPDGLKVMTELDYKMGQSSHTQYSIQQGETHVTVVLPNVTGSTNQNTLNTIGRSLGDGISNGRLSSYRTQISGNPNGYRVLY